MPCAHQTIDLSTLRQQQVQAAGACAQPHHVRDELCLDLDYIKELLAAKTAELTIQLESMI